MGKTVPPRFFALAHSRLQYRSSIFRLSICVFVLSSVRPSVNIQVKSSINVCFSSLVIAASVKPGVVIVLYIIFKHAPCTGALDLHFTLQLQVSIFYLESRIKVHFSADITATCVKSLILIVL